MKKRLLAVYGVFLMKLANAFQYPADKLRSHAYGVATRMLFL